MKQLLGVIAALGIAVCAATAHADDHRGQYYDQRYNHNHYYPARGAVVRYAPSDRYSVYRGRDRYFYSGGVWYRPRGPRFLVVGPPLGVYVPILPRFYATLWFGGVPYYYANETYYVYRGRDRGYETVDAPRGAPQRTSNEEDGAASASDDIFVYPKNGQDEEQTSKDRYECHEWAVKETNFDPTQNGGGVSDDQRASARGSYSRAMTACLEGRGYSVK